MSVKDKNNCLDMLKVTSKSESIFEILERKSEQREYSTIASSSPKSLMFILYEKSLSNFASLLTKAL